MRSIRWAFVAAADETQTHLRYRQKHLKASPFTFASKSRSAADLALLKMGKKLSNVVIRGPSAPIVPWPMVSIDIAQTSLHARHQARNQEIRQAARSMT